MKFSIIIPTYNNYPQLLRCLRSLEISEYQDFEVFSCIDGSTDGTEGKLRESDFPFPLTVLNHPDKLNHGRAATRNLALRHISGEYVVFLDSDMVCEPDFLKAHLEFLEKGNSVSIGKIYYQNKSANCWAKYISERGIEKSEGGAEVPARYFITANTAIPAVWFRELQGFDENIRHYGGEDMELGYRIEKNYSPTFYFNHKSLVSTVQDKSVDQALMELREYGRYGLPYITSKFPELSNVYWVNKCRSSNPVDRLFEFSTRKPFRIVARALMKISPWFLKKLWLNYLVVSNVHKGFRDRMQKG